MRCRDVFELLDDHVEGKLPPGAGWRMRLHLWICRHCRRYLSSYRTTIRAEKAAFAEPSSVAPPELPESIVTSILARRTSGDQLRWDSDETSRPSA